MNKKSSTTLLQSIQRSLEQAGRFNSNDMEAPAAILWPDPEEQWLPLIHHLIPLMDNLFILGEYNIEKRTGPAIWLRCIVDRTLVDIQCPQDKIPVLYLPKLSRQDLRAGEECPDLLKPLVELQYRGTVWTQKNGRDWTVETFMVSEDGLGLEVAHDKQTRISMLGSLEQLATTPVSRLWDKKLEAEDFDKLMTTDTPRDILSWMNQPKEMRENWGQNVWNAFVSRCKADYELDPEKYGEFVAAEKLGRQTEDTWKGIWQRFKEAPVLYPNIAILLKQAKPVGELIFDNEPWPDENEKEEALLREELRAFDKLNPAEAREKVMSLEKGHGYRRDWVWAQLGHSKCAQALIWLNMLAQNTETTIGGETPEEMVTVYMKTGYQADIAMLKALNAVPSTEDFKAVKTALRTLYLPWLEQTAQHFQQLVLKAPLNKGKQNIKSKTCWLFVDGLCYHLAVLLKELLEKRNFNVSLKHQWAALPTVTATSKTAISPISNQFKGNELGENFSPVLKSDQSYNSERFKKTLAENGYQVIESTDIGEPTKENSIGWTEWGKFDELGHDLGIKLVSQIDDQFEQLLYRIHELLLAGWKNIHLVTDHGWLLIPDGSPKVDLPKYLLKSRWARCAAIKVDSHIEMPKTQWHWNKNEYFVFAPGIHCFEKGYEFSHGGVSLQECLIPEMDISLGDNKPDIVIHVKNVQWVGLRCRIEINPAEHIKVDLRTRPNDPASSITTPKDIDEQGYTSLLVEDDSLQGTVVSLVFLDSTGQMVSKQITSVGGEQ